LCVSINLRIYSHCIVETGEEDEETIFTCRAKLFHFEEKQWKERGVGNLKINVRYEPKSDLKPEADDEEALGIEVMERRARVLMRTDGVHRVILNSPVFKEMNVGTKDGKEPSGRTMMLTGMEEGKPKGFQIRVGEFLGLYGDWWLTCTDRQGRRSERSLS
jgi:Ran-binding protein 3